MKSAENRIVARFETAMSSLAETAKDELEQQGHRASGRLIESVESVLKNRNLSALVGTVEMEQHGQFVNSGVSAQNVRVPISALIEWAKYVQPQMSEKERRSFAFAVRKTMQKEGMPTRGSFAFSQNQRRKEFIIYGIENMIPSDWGQTLELESEFMQIIENQ